MEVGQAFQPALLPHGRLESLPHELSLMRKVALSFLAHPDDAEMLCAGTLLRLKAAGYEIRIATATPGDCGTMNYDRWQIAAIRTAEGRAAAALIGGTYHCLDERDGFVVFDKPTLAKTYDLFRAIAPTLVFTHPREDYMIDHEQTHLLARAAAFLFAAPNISRRPLACADAKIPHLYYCDPVEGIDHWGQTAATTTLIDVSAVHTQKLAMLACHVSQRDWLRAHHGMDEYLESCCRQDAARGALIGVAQAEGFVQHRGHAFPADDLLKEICPT